MQATLTSPNELFNHPVERSEPAISAKRRWFGRIVSAIPVLFLTLDSTMKLLKLPVVIEGTVKLGYPVSSVFTLGVILLASTIAYVIPRTAVLGAVVLTGYLGGAIATHVRVGDPLFSHILFPIYVAILIWGGLYLRDPALRSVVPWRSRA